MSPRAAIRAVLSAALLLTASCGGGAQKPPRATLGAPTSGGAAESDIRFEDLPVTRLDRARVPTPNAANPSQGATNAQVVVQLWSDFECPFCADVHPALTEMLRVYAGKVQLVWHDYPLPFHAHARLAANAGREAYAQGGSAAFWKFHDAIYTTSSPKLDTEGLVGFALKAGLDPTRFRDALTTQRHDAEIKRDLDVGNVLGVEGTPAFLVNDYFFVGAVPFEILRVVVDRALSDAGA
ncbi:MAG TPA: thioredoxin domain-containing protein [Polyangiaceae bacterium]|nr:thioredoxin domain-containing protein [Polyangiaceae bacterium]